MATIHTDIDIEIVDYLDEVSLLDLKEHLIERGYSIIQGVAKSVDTKPISLFDQMKLDDFQAKFKLIPSDELNKFLNKY